MCTLPIVYFKFLKTDSSALSLSDVRDKILHQAFCIMGCHVKLRIFPINPSD